ncbi:MAG: adenylate/guanylate cyclase domain-containing protein [Ilumatobacteraceae bacterium]
MSHPSCTPRGPSATTTLLFTDIEASTRQWEESAGMYQRVEAHFDVLRAAIDAAGGTIFATMGDGVAAAFTSVDGAVQAAIAGQRQMASTGLSVRMGIHTGDVERAGADLRGRALNRAARIMAAGHGGQILLSDVSAALLRSGPSPVGLVDVGTHRLRDLAEPERMWQVAHPELRDAFPAVRGVDSYANNLPAQRSSLIGRELDVQRVVSTVHRHRVVTLTGTGGVGKTRLAIHAAADLLAERGDVWFVELANVSDPDDVADVIALTIGAAAVPDPLAAAATLLAGAPTLLVIDNCEHVLDAVAVAIETLTAACSTLSVLATSRERLGIDGERVLPVRPLDPATSIELFHQRAAAAGADLDRVERRSIAVLCRRLDGIPLAIELAAARTATLGVSTILGALDDRFALLDAARKRGDDRHGTMRATIDWSYRLLDDAEQQLFVHLAVFRSGMEIDAVRHVAGSLGIADPAATDHLVSLVDKNMLVAEPHPSGVRYRMLETVRAFALEQLDERGDRLAASASHAEWVTTITDLPFADCCNAAVERSTLRLEREADNWREAVVHAARIGSGELAARLCGPPVDYFLLGRHDLVDVVRPLLEACRDDVFHRRAVLSALIVSSSGAADIVQLQSWANEVQAADDRAPTGVGGLMRWMSSAWRGDFETSVDICVESSLDERYARGTRDMFVGIAVLDRFSLTDATDDPHGLIPRALEIAGRSDVAIHRVTCRLGAAWGLADREPERSLELVSLALDDIPHVPALTRLTLPGSASRLLARLDPQVAARGLLAQLDGSPLRRSFVDLIPLFYAAELLHRLGHPAVERPLAQLTVSPVAPYLSMMDFIDLARRAFTTGDARSLGGLEVAVRDGLVQVAGAAA